MHRPLPCQSVSLASEMLIVGGHLLPQNIKKAPSKRRSMDHIHPDNLEIVKLISTSTHHIYQ